MYLTTLMFNLFYTVMDAIENREEGQGMSEYALIVALIAVALVAALIAVKGGISGVFSNIISSFSAA